MVRSRSIAVLVFAALFAPAVAALARPALRLPGRHAAPLILPPRADGSRKALASRPGPGGGAATVEHFEREIRPLLITKCQGCHGEKDARGGLRLTSRTALLAGGARGAAVAPGKPEESLLIHAVEYRGDLKMPPTGKLSEREIAALKRWVAAGAVWPVGGMQRQSAVEAPVAPRQHWAFRPLRSVAPPAVGGPGLAPIDRFVRAELTRRGLAPAPPADRRTLIRRATFDLTGLPPTPEEVEAFRRDTAPGAFARVVDRLLASPAYGERYARHWLDVARYADYHDGDPKARVASCDPLMAWRYRDWVVSALNRDLPFDRFIIHQLAGDLLPSPDGLELYADGLVATTFLTDGTWDRGDADKEKMVSDMVDDQIDTTGKAFLGLTLGCARCHDHKFDPVSQADYYALAGIFYSTHILKDIGTKGGEYTLNRVPLAPKAYVEKREKQLAELAAVNQELAELDKRMPKPAADEPARVALLGRRDRLQGELLPEPPLAEAAQEGGTAGGLFPKIQDVPIHIRGSYTRLGAVVPRRMPTFFAGKVQRPIASGSGRKELAEWIASPKNPLTARVIVNRVWQWHFGEGLVRTPNNFGLRSEPPSHPALLDWLAARLIEDGWSLKKLHRRIMLSATYLQSSVVRRELAAHDPENRWLGRFAARRLEAEAIRDAMLAVSGRLDATAGGPASADLAIPRRSLYVQTARWDRGSFALLFDAANPDASTDHRSVSTVAPQALFLLNHEFTLAQARALAERLARDVPEDETARIQRAHQLLFSRPATAAELRLCQELLTRAGSHEGAWVDLAHVLLCSNEFVYLD
jgi:cytochrome c553